MLKKKKAKKDGGKKADKEKELEEQILMIKLEKESYQTQISDLQQEYERCINFKFSISTVIS